MIRKMSRYTLFILIICIFKAYTPVWAQEKTQYPDIPRIDAHTHAGIDQDNIAAYLDLREVMKRVHNVDYAMWINLGDSKKPIENYDEVMKAGKGRMLCCISDYSPHTGLKIPPSELQKCLDQGYIGYKIWSGPPHRRLKPGQKGYPYVDDPAHDPTFAQMEKIGMVGASIHIADPNGPWGDRTEWLPDPVEYWKQITAWRHVLERHPNLTAVTAHGIWLMCQDAQIDYLRNMLSTFPGLHIDLAATFQYFHMVNRENLRSFMIEYADRILFGTDVSRWSGKKETKRKAQRYFQCFQILETDKTIAGGFFDQKETQGLALPREVLEKIYYKNAMRIYPHVKESMIKLGYDVE
jgi:uncharacterized protein